MNDELQKAKDALETAQSAVRLARALLTKTGEVQYDSVEVEHFKPSGKYYCTDTWRIPLGSQLGPHVMVDSPDFRDIGMTIVVPAQEPWGFPHVLKTVPKEN